MKTLDLVIPMAGRGSRFAEQGYDLPKPLVDVNGLPMIQRVIENLRPKVEHRFIFLVLKEHLEKYGIAEKLESWAGPQTKCVVVDRVTEGAACTVLLAQSILSSENDMVIANSDQIIDSSLHEFVCHSRNESLDGNIMVFRDIEKNPKWSFAKLSDKNEVVEVAEKKPISDLATVGIYYFASGAAFVAGAGQMISKNIKTNNEYYVCPVYNELILQGQVVKVWMIQQSQMHGIGTPEDLDRYLDLQS